MQPPSNPLPPSVHYLATKIAELEAALAMMIEERVARDARIANLEKNQREPDAVKEPAPSAARQI